MKTKVRFHLVQDDKRMSRTIVDVEYEYNGKAKLNVEKVAQSMTKTVFRKLDAQKQSGVNFGIKISRPFNLLVDINDKRVLSLSKCQVQSGTVSKLKVNQKQFKENPTNAKKMFQTAIIAVVTEAKASQSDFRKSIDLVQTETTES